MIDSKKILCVITARGGSKAIPLKNVKLLMGQPLFMWSVYASLSSQYIDKTVISSNCPEVEKIYTNRMNTGSGWDFINTSNLEFIKRPDEISGDLSKNEEALIHAYKFLKENFSVVINLQPTSPNRINRLLDLTIEEYHNGGYDSLLTGKLVTPFLWRKKDGKWIYPVDYNDCCNRKMRQEFRNVDGDNSDMLIHDDGNIYITDAKILLDKECRIGYNPCVFEVDRFNSLQIDEEFDFQLIEEMAKSKGLNTLVDGWTEL